jgi:hypothetical protein
MMRLHLSRNNHLMGTRLLPSSDDRDNIFSRTLLLNPQTEIKVNQNTPVTGTVYPYLCPLPLLLFPLKAITLVCTLKMAEDGLSTYFASSHGMSQAV